MKKIFLMALLLPFVLFSCQTNEEERGNGTGQISLTGNKGIELSDPTHVTRADADVNQFTVIVADEDDPGNVVSGLFSSFAGGVIDNLRVGSYTVTLTSHPDGFTPAFYDPMYQGVKENVPVTAGGNTLIEIEAVQANSGVYFVYDESLYTIGQFTEVVPTITQGIYSLVYENADAEAWGYFNPSPAVLTIKDGNESVTISGEYEQTLNLTGEQLLEITLRAQTSGADGSITIVATVKVITSPTDFEEFILGKGEPVGPEGFVTIEVSNLATWSATTTVTAVEGHYISSMYYICLTQSYLADLLEQYGTVEGVMQARGTELPLLYLSAVNGDGLNINWNLTSVERDYAAIMYAQSGTEWAVTRADFTVPESTSPIGEGDYSWTWYDTFNADFSNYSDPWVNWLEVKEATGQDYDFVITDFYGIGGLDMTAMYDEDAGTLTLTGYDTEGYSYVNTPDGLYMGLFQYSAGFYVRDADMNLVDSIVFTVEDGEIAECVYNVSMDVFTYGTENFLYTDAMTPAGGRLTYYGLYSANYAPSNSAIKLVNTKAQSTVGAPILKATSLNAK